MHSNSVCKFVTVFIIATLVLFYIIGKPKNVIYRFYFMPTDISSEYVQAMDFFNRTQPKCTDFTTDWESVPMSETFKNNMGTFEATYKQVLNGKDPIEGCTGEVASKFKVLHHIAKSPSIKTICETGFNYGHSSYNFLSSNPTAKVFSFDLGQHSHVAAMNETIVKIFSSKRFRLTLGDSKKTVPKAIQEGWLPPCDLIFVDGGHVYDVAKSDLVHFVSHSSPESVVFFDDWPTLWGKSFGIVWDEVLLPGMLVKNEQLNVNEIRGKIMKDLLKSNLQKGSFEYRSKSFRIKETIRCRVPGKFDKGYSAGIAIRV